MSTTLEQATDDAPAGLLRALLEESRELTAVERFAKEHDEGGAPAQSKYYRDLIPTGTPGEGQQYAFEVDLDACSGCKACVSACHHMNGLEPEETWRSVGQLYGGSSSGNDGGLPVIQHVTTACHHCVDPGCLNGCPTNAYEKDPETGIVRHLDDQCFGCQYCTMACPYEVPQYSESKGIVRKCDMCHGRLAAGEAPACVAACPNGAIKISVVDVSEMVAQTRKGLFLPDSPPPQLTNPTTLYKTDRGLPVNSVGADYGHAQPQHAHLPLVVMLVLTQMSVGVMAFGAIARWLGCGAWADATLVIGMLAGQAGLAVAPLHLGRPHLAFRAVLGWRHSWLSREAILFGVYAAFSVPAAILATLPYIQEYVPDAVMSLVDTVLPNALRTPLELASIIAGAIAVYCSAKIYMFTGRKFWLGEKTLLRFGLTPVVLGLGVVTAAAAIGGGLAFGWAMLLVFVAAGKLIFESTSLSETEGDLGLTAQLQRGPLSKVTQVRFITGGVGIAAAIATAVGVMPMLFGTATVLALLVGELVERYLYFSSVVPLRMPGGAPAR